MFLYLFFLYRRILIRPFDTVFGVFDESVKAVSECLSARMFPLRILGRVIADIDLQGGCSDYTRILFVLRFTQFDALDGNGSEAGRRIYTFLPLDVITTRGQRFRRLGSRNSAPDILILEMMLIILLQIMWIVYWL